MTSRTRRWRIIPKITFHNWSCHPLSHHMRMGWSKWFSIERRWHGRIIYVCVRQFMVELDFRYNWIADLTEPEARKIVNRLGI